MKPAMVATLLLCAAAAAAQPVTAQQAEGWTVVDYASLVDGRQMSHAGDPVGRLLEKLGGRTFPPAGQRPGDGALYALLEPLVEPYAFVLSDVLDTLEPPAKSPWIEVARLWEPGERQPAWAELLRARRYVVESDGAGTLRVVLPWQPTGDPRQVPAATAARQAWDDAWPVLRHVFAAERRRLARDGALASLKVRAYPYAHQAARSAFLLGLTAHRVEVDDTRSTGDRPPLDLSALEAFLQTGWTLEGGKLDAEGRLTPLASRRETPATILGRKPTMADLAVAFRASSYGGRAEPYMSLDPGYSPWLSLVNYGARLRDTTLGLVSLLCDVRFKTFSTGLGIGEGQDMRDTLRGDSPSFRTHLERFAGDPLAIGVSAQQTRLWFYPDRVDLTVSPQSDVLAMRHVRMTAASERVVDQTMTPVGGPEPPWTKATLESINSDYDALARSLPELRDLDQVVRLLSFFTWLDQTAIGGGRVPDLEALLAYDLPALTTPRVFPQLLAYEAMPATASDAPVVDSFDRVEVADSLERLNPRAGLLDAPDRLQRALAGLEREIAEEAAFLDQVAGRSGSMSAAEMDVVSYQAQRLRMHRTVLGSLDAERSRKVEDRFAGAERRVFSVAVGGLDLDMSEALSRARSRSIGLLGAGGGVPAASPEASARLAPAPVSDETRALWREDPPGLPQTVIPEHGTTFAGGWVEQAEGRRLVVYSADGPEVAARTVWLDEAGQPQRFARLEGGREWRYALEKRSGGYRAVPEPAEPTTTPAALPETLELPAGLAVVEVDPSGTAAPTSDTVVMRLRGPGSGGPLDAAVPRWVLQRLVMGREADLARDPSLPGLAPLPGLLGEVESLMVVSGKPARPWERSRIALPGEQDPLNVAGAIDEWWDAPDAPPVPGGAVVGNDGVHSLERWAGAPRPGARALLVLPADGFPFQEDLAANLAASWRGGRVAERAEPAAGETLVVVVSAEPPGLFSRRLREIAARPEMKGKLLAGWSLAGPLRDDLAAWILDETGVAGVATASWSVVGRRTAPEHLAAFTSELSARGKKDRVESIPGPFLWQF
jgi:hypothetical protein